MFAGKRERLAEGLRLQRAAVAPVLVISDGGRLGSRNGRACGNPPPDVEVVCVTPRASSTVAEAAAFAGLAGRRGWGSIALVTPAYHVHRARLLLARCNRGRAAAVAVPGRAGPGLVGDILHEWAGLVVAVTVQRRC